MPVAPRQLNVARAVRFEIQTIIAKGITAELEVLLMSLEHVLLD